MAEPGRFFAETAFALAASVIGKRVRGEFREYRINDGFYGSLNCYRLKGVVAKAIRLPGSRSKGKMVIRHTRQRCSVRVATHMM